MAEVCKITRIHKKALRNHAELFVYTSNVLYLSYFTPLSLS